MDWESRLLCTQHSRRHRFRIVFDEQRRVAVPVEQMQLRWRPVVIGGHVVALVAQPRIVPTQWWRWYSALLGLSLRLRRLRLLLLL